MSDLEQFILNRMVWEAGSKFVLSCRNFLSARLKKAPDQGEDVKLLANLVEKGTDEPATRLALLELVKKLELEKDPEFLKLLESGSGPASSGGKQEMSSYGETEFMIGQVLGDVNVVKNGGKD